MFTSGHFSTIVTIIYVEIKAPCFVFIVCWVSFLVFFLFRPPAPVLWGFGDGKHKTMRPPLAYMTQIYIVTGHSNRVHNVCELFAHILEDVTIKV